MKFFKRAQNFFDDSDTVELGNQKLEAHQSPDSNNVEDEGEGHAEVITVEEGEEPAVQEFSFKLPLVPGSDVDNDQDLVVEEPEDEVEVEELDSWDWGKLSNFMPWLQKMFNGIPPHSGYEISGVERAMAYLESLERSISKAIRSDIRNELKVADVESARDEINKGIKGLQDRLDKLLTHKGRKAKKKNAEADGLIVKEAQKIAGVNGIVVTVPLLISRIARVCINGMVSGGHDIEALFDAQVKKYDLTNREQAETMQLLEDMGYAMRRDRFTSRDEKFDPTSSDNGDWAANYPA